MDEYVHKTFEVDGLTVKIVHDSDPSSPREWDNLGTMFCAHRRYELGDEQFDPDDYNTMGEFLTELREEHGATVILPLYLYDHGGISMSTGNFNDPWDSSQVGWICDTREQRKLLGFEVDRFGRDEDSKTLIKGILEGEVETYDAYLRGEVYGFVVEDGDGEFLDSCWGFYDAKDAEGEGRSVAEYEIKERREKLAKEQAEAIAESATLAWNGEYVEVNA